MQILFNQCPLTVYGQQYFISLYRQPNKKSMQSIWFDFKIGYISKRIQNKHCTFSQKRFVNIVSRNKRKLIDRNKK